MPSTRRSLARLAAGALLGAATIAALPAAREAAAQDAWHSGGPLLAGEREQRVYEPPRRDSSSPRYGPSQRDEHVGGWAIGTFYGRNSGNGNEETLTIRPDGSAELRTRDEPPKYGTFAGETLNVGQRVSRVQPARGGIVVDGSYYRR